MMGSCEHCNEPFSCIKVRNFLTVDRQSAFEDQMCFKSFSLIQTQLYFLKSTNYKVPQCVITLIILYWDYPLISGATQYVFSPQSGSSTSSRNIVGMYLFQNTERWIKSRKRAILNRRLCFSNSCYCPRSSDTFCKRSFLYIESDIPALIMMSVPSFMKIRRFIISGTHTDMVTL